MIVRRRYSWITLHNFLLMLILLLALALRVDFIRSVHHELSPDAMNYSTMATQLLEKGVYGYADSEPNAYVTPGYPLFLTVSFWMADTLGIKPHTLTRYLQIGLSLGILIMIYVLTYGLSASRLPALVAAFVAAIYPPFVWANGAILTEVLGTFFLLAYLLMQFYAFDSPRRIHSLLAGVLLGLTVMVRPEFLPIVFGLQVFRWWQKRKFSQWRPFLYVLLGIVLVLFPWWVRNVVTLHDFIPLATQTNPFLAGTFPYNDYSKMLVDPEGKSEMELAKERLLIGFTKHPRTFAWWYTFGKIEFLYSSMYYGGGFAPEYPVILSGSLLHNAIFWFGMAAVFISLLRPRWRHNMLAVVIVVMSFIRLAFVPEYRYNFMLMPLFIVMVCVTFHFIRRLIQLRGGSSDHVS